MILFLHEMNDNEFCDILQLITHYDGQRNLKTKVAIQDTLRFFEGKSISYFENKDIEWEKKFAREIFKDSPFMKEIYLECIRRSMLYSTK